MNTDNPIVGDRAKIKRFSSGRYQTLFCQFAVFEILMQILQFLMQLGCDFNHEMIFHHRSLKRDVKISYLKSLSVLGDLES